MMPWRTGFSVPGAEATVVDGPERPAEVVDVALPPAPGPALPAARWAWLHPAATRTAAVSGGTSRQPRRVRARLVTRSDLRSNHSFFAAAGPFGLPRPSGGTVYGRQGSDRSRGDRLAAG